MKKTIGFLLLLLLISCVNEVEQPQTESKTDDIFQYGTKNSLLTNIYTGNVTVGEIKKEGNFGLGTFNMIDGEMVIYNGNVYQVLPSGKINNMPSAIKVPFVVTKFFNPDTSFSLPNNISLDSAKVILQKIIGHKNLPAAIRINSHFDSLKCRSVYKVKNNSVSLAEIIAKQKIFNFADKEGTVIGFWYPDYFDGVNFSGFHFHVMLKNISGGGHILNCKFRSAAVEIDFASGVNVLMNK